MTEPRINEPGKNTSEFWLTVAFNIALMLLQVADIALDTFDLGASQIIAAAAVNSFFGILRLVAKLKGVQLLTPPQE